MVLTLPVLRVQASPVTFTGADLLNLPAVSLPHGQPAFGPGSSIVFDLVEDSSILLSIALDDLVEDPANLSGSINLTRRTGDFDPHLILTDGVRGVGAFISDNDGGGFRGLPDVSLLSAQKIDRGAISPVINGVGFPELDSSFDLFYNFIVSATGVSVSIDVLGANLSISSSTVLNQSNGLSLLLVSDLLAAGETYQVNALTLSNALVSEPSFLAFIGFPFLGFVARRRWLSRTTLR